MKKNILIASLLVLFSFGAMAQKDNAVSIGVKGGINMPRMHYVNNKYLSSLPQAWKITPTGGVFVDVPIGDVMRIDEELILPNYFLNLYYGCSIRLVRDVAE